MKHISTLYYDKNHLKDFLLFQGVKSEEQCIARVVSSQLERPQIEQLIEELTTLLPNVQIIGMISQSAVIHNSKLEENATMISMEFCDRLTLTRHKFKYKNRNYKKVATELHSTYGLASLTNTTVHILAHSSFRYLSELLEELNQCPDPIHLAGAVIGALPCGEMGFVFDEHGIYEDVIYTYTLEGNNARHYLSCNISYEIIQEEVQEITKIDHDWIQEVNGRDSIEWLYDYLGVMNKDFPITDELLTHFPIVLDGGTTSRFLHYDPETGKVVIHHETSLPLGTKFQKGCISPNFTLQNTHKSLLTMLDQPMESIFLYTCLFRKIYLSNCIQWELSPFVDFNVCGMLAIGEIVFYEGKNQLHHGSSIFTGIAEYEKYIIPNMDQLHDTDWIETATVHLGGLLKQAMPEYAEDIMFSLTSHDMVEHYEEHYDRVDAHLQIHNMFQYDEDKESHEFRKICFVELNSANSIIDYMGLNLYYTLFSEITNHIKDKIQFECGRKIFSYCFNYKTLFYTCADDVSDEEFTAIFKGIHDDVCGMSPSQEELNFDLQFLILTQSDDLLEEGIKILFEHREEVSHFIVDP